MEQRTFGWIQEASSFEGLISLCELFFKGSSTYNKLVKETYPLLKYNNCIKTEDDVVFNKYFANVKYDGTTPIGYLDLKGKGIQGGNRSNAPCSGLAQTISSAQSKRKYNLPNGSSVCIKKPYTSDWVADSFVRWGISIGLLSYDNERDTCTLTQNGKDLVEAATISEKYKIIGKVLLSYPPVVRVLNLLVETSVPLTKFEIGHNLGFIGEAGFTSYDQNQWIAEYVSYPEKRKSMKSDYEGSSDKYARMICGWLYKLGYVKKGKRNVTEVYCGKEYMASLQTYEITFIGRDYYKKALGYSKNPRIPRIVMYGMLATKTPNTDSVRFRRALILQNITKQRSAADLVDVLKENGITEASVDIVKADVYGLINMGLEIKIEADKYVLKDKIEGLTIPRSVKYDGTFVRDKTKIMSLIPNVDHKYLTLIDLAYQGQNASRDFEVLTSELFINELHYNGMLLGGTSKPDNIIYYESNGAIIDNKSYSKGYNLSRGQKDEMIRYLQENKDRNEQINPNRWWDNFPSEVNKFNFVFVSSEFKGKINESIENIALRTNVNGAGLTVETMLYMAQSVLSGKKTRTEVFNAFSKNRVLQPDDFGINTEVDQ